MDKSFSTYLVDVANIPGGLPSSGGMRGGNGRMLAQYFNPRLYSNLTPSKSLLVGLGVLSGIGMFALGAYAMYVLVSGEDLSSSSLLEISDQRIRRVTVAREKDSVVDSMVKPGVVKRSVVSNELRERTIHKRPDILMIHDDDYPGSWLDKGLG